MFSRTKTHSNAYNSVAANLVLIICRLQEIVIPTINLYPQTTYKQ